MNDIRHYFFEEFEGQDEAQRKTVSLLPALITAIENDNNEVLIFHSYGYGCVIVTPTDHNDAELGRIYKEWDEARTAQHFAHDR